MKTLKRLSLSLPLMVVMLLGLSCLAFAADYSVRVTSDDEIIFRRSGENESTYDARNTDISLRRDRDDDLLVCFINSRGVEKAISVGRQNALTISGEIDSLTMESSLGSKTDVVVGSGSRVEELNVNSTGKVRINGRVDYLRVTRDAAEIEVGKDGDVRDGGVVRKSQISGSGDYDVSVRYNDGYRYDGYYYDDYYYRNNYCYDPYYYNGYYHYPYYNSDYYSYYNRTPAVDRDYYYNKYGEDYYHYRDDNYAYRSDDGYIYYGPYGRPYTR